MLDWERAAYERVHGTRLVERAVEGDRRGSAVRLAAADLELIVRIDRNGGYGAAGWGG
jgi:hypothetical protein